MNACSGIVLVSLILLSTACQHFPSTHGESLNSQAYTRITEDNVSVLFDKRLELAGDFMSMSDDGTFEGTWNDTPIAGTWKMREGYWCRVLTEFHDNSIKGKEKCHLVELGVNTVRGTRNRGNGNSYLYHFR